MSTGLFDIASKTEVQTLDEIQAAVVYCLQKRIDTVEFGPRVVTVPEMVEIAKNRWKRAVATSRMIDAMREGYCSVSPVGSPPASDARH